MRAVTFDFGMTICELDTDMLARRIGEQALSVSAQELALAQPAAWCAYNDAIRAGHGGHPWKLFMRTLLGGAGAPPSSVNRIADWLWDEQPARNLWRRPIPGMIELVRELSAQTPVGIVSNSEGRLAELVEELGWADLFRVVADSGRLGCEKPARALFAHAADRLGVPLDDIVHIGDSLEADVKGALAAGMRAIWFGAGPAAEDAEEPPDPRMRRCRTASEVRAALGTWGFPL
jgi:putative hydrolase of the HAD superfamily